MTTAAPDPLWVTVDQVQREPATIAWQADEAARRAIAERLEIPRILALTGSLRVTPVDGEGLRVEGALTAQVELTCSASGDEFVEDLADSIDVTFVPDADQAGTSGGGAFDMIVEPGSDDAPEPLTDGRIDAVEVIVESLALALPITPRRPDLEFQDVEIGDVEPPEGPLAGLRKLLDH